MTTMTTKEAQDKYLAMYRKWHVYCDSSAGDEMMNRGRYTPAELITMSRMDFYYNYSYVRGMREAGDTDNYLYWERYEEMVWARTNLAYWLKKSRENAHV